MKSLFFFIAQMIIISVLSIIAGVTAGMLTEWLIEGENSRIGSFVHKYKGRKVSFTRVRPLEQAA